MIIRLWARRRVGAGTLVISASGFRDSRLSEQTVAWAICEKATRDAVPKGGVRGVKLRVADGVEAPSTSLAYRWAFNLPRKSGRFLYIELAGAQGAADLADVVEALVSRHTR